MMQTSLPTMYVATTMDIWAQTYVCTSFVCDDLITYMAGEVRFVTSLPTMYVATTMDIWAQTYVCTSFVCDDLNVHGKWGGFSHLTTRFQKCHLNFLLTSHAFPPYYSPLNDRPGP